MFKIKLGKKGAEKGSEQYGDHHQMLVELMPAVLGIVVVLILGLLLLLLLQHVHIMRVVTDIAAKL